MYYANRYLIEDKCFLQNTVVERFPDVVFA